MTAKMAGLCMRILFCILYIKKLGAIAAEITKSLHTSQSTTGRITEQFEREKLLPDQIKLTPVLCGGGKGAQVYPNRLEKTSPYTDIN